METQVGTGKRLLVLCFPTWGRNNELHLNSTGQHVVLAPDEMIGLLERLGVAVDVAALGEIRTHLPLMRSKKRFLPLEKLDLGSYDAFWHMFRDPTQPEVLELLERGRFDFGDKRVINDVRFLQHHHKWHYLPVLHKHGIGPQAFPDFDVRQAARANWSTPSYGASVGEVDGRPVIGTSAFNNNRGDYPERRPRETIYAEYLDNSAGGIRSFFRLGYSLGRVTSGWLYCSPAEALTLKSGSCKHQIPFQLPERYHATLVRCLQELGIDVCHFEGLFVKERLYVFDINPYPTAHGATLSGITAEICRYVAEALHA